MKGATFHSKQFGFTLMEMIISLTVLGLLSVVMLPLLSLPMTSYMDTQRRVELQSQLDLIRSKLADDLQYALPTSLRWKKVGGVCYLEYLEVKATGRYRSNDTGGPAGYCPAVPAPPAVSCHAGSGLAFGCATEACFTTLGPISPSTATLTNTDYAAVVAAATPSPYTLSTTSPMVRLTSGNTALANSSAGMKFANHSFPLPSPSSRVYVVTQPVSYAFNTTGLLTKYWGYGIQAAQPGPLAAATLNARLANTVNDCDIQVRQTGLRQVVSVKLKLSAVVAGQPTESIDGFMQFSVTEP